MHNFIASVEFCGGFIFGLYSGFGKKFGNCGLCAGDMHFGNIILKKIATETAVQF